MAKTLLSQQQQARQCQYVIQGWFRDSQWTIETPHEARVVAAALIYEAERLRNLATSLEAQEHHELASPSASYC